MKRRAKGHLVDLKRGFLVFGLIGALAGIGCGGQGPDAAEPADIESYGDEKGDGAGPGALATDQRVPELGDDIGVLYATQMWLADGLAQAQGPVIEAKFELDDSKKLSLSVYPVKSLDLDAERNVFQELSGDPSATPFAGSLETFQDQEHLTRSSRDLTLVQLSQLGVGDAIDIASEDGFVYWAIPTIRRGRAGYGVYTFDGYDPRYRFLDGRGSRARTRSSLPDLGDGPGDAATDARTPELGDDLGILRTSRITMAQALAQMERQHGPAIEAKFELDDSGKLSLSIYPVGKGIDVDAERNQFFELSGDPTATQFSPSLAEFTVPDAEHLTRAARDLTLVQVASAAGLSLKGAVKIAQAQVPGGLVYWAIPTIRNTRAGYGVYVYGPDGRVHYFFVS
jgi:hypothetical protein